MSFEVAIPSYNRPDTLVAKTLTYLRRSGIPDTWITVFVEPSQREPYMYSLINADFAGRVAPGVPGIGNQRNLIEKHYPVGTRVLSVDDDISDVRVKVTDKQTESLDDLFNWAEQAFHHTEQFGAKIWGINPVLNPYFMKHKVSTDLRYIIACFYGFIATHDDELQVGCDDKEDYERSILYYRKHGVVIRFNDVAPDTRYYREPGGMQTYRTMETIRDGVRYLLRNYPEFCVMNTRKKSEYPEVILKDRRGRGRFREMRPNATTA